MIAPKSDADVVQSDREQAPLPERLETARRMVIQITELGVALTKAVIDVGLGEFSANADFAVLGRLSMDGPTRPKDLLGSVQLSRGGLSNLFDRLESADLITRTYGQVKGDRRGALVSITEAGAAVAEKIADTIARSLAQQHLAVRALTETFAEFAPDRSPQNMSNAEHENEIDRIALFGQMGLALEEAFAVDDPTPGKRAIVLCSAAQPGQTRPKELMERTQLSSGGVTQLLDRLENEGLISRTTGRPPDRRAVIVAPTPRGRVELERLLNEFTIRLGALQRAIDRLES